MKTWHLALVLWLIIAAGVAAGLYKRAEERYKASDAQLLTLLADNHRRCAALAELLMNRFTAGDYSPTELDQEAAQVDLAVFEKTQEIIREILAGRDADRPGREALVDMAASQSRICELARSPGSHSLLTFRAAVATHSEAFRTAEARAAIELGSPAATSLEASYLARLAAAEGSVRSSWEKKRREAEAAFAKIQQQAAAEAEAARLREQEIEAERLANAEKDAEKERLAKAEQERKNQEILAAQRSDRILRVAREKEYVRAVRSLETRTSTRVDGKDLVVVLEGHNPSTIHVQIEVTARAYLRLRNRNLPLKARKGMASIAPGTDFRLEILLEATADHSPGVDVVIEPDGYSMHLYARG